MHLVAERFVFLGGDDRGFLKEGVKAYRMASMSPLNSPTFFCFQFFDFSHLYPVEGNEVIPMQNMLSRIRTASEVKLMVFNFTFNS
jgi:hypothetical protein